MKGQLSCTCLPHQGNWEKAGGGRRLGGGERRSQALRERERAGSLAHVLWSEAEGEASKSSLMG